jgi:hypothetical protein
MVKTQDKANNEKNLLMNHLTYNGTISGGTTD